MVRGYKTGTLARNELIVHYRSAQISSDIDFIFMFLFNMKLESLKTLYQQGIKTEFS